MAQRVFFLPPARHRYRCSDVEGPQPPPSPACEEVAGLFALVFVLCFPQPSREFEECAEQGSAVIVHEFDQPGFLDEPAQLDQMPRARPPIPHPLSFVIARPISVRPVTQHGQALELRRRCPKLRQQARRALPWSPACRLPERMFARVRSTS